MPEKQFVKAKPLLPKDRGGGPKEYQSREPKKNAKKYEEKQKIQQKDSRDGIKLMLAAYKPVRKTKITLDLQKKYPKLFLQNAQKPSKDGDFNFNDCLRLGPKKQPFSKPTKPLQSDSSQPDWDSDCEKEVKLTSKKIDENIIKKVEEQLKKQPLRKVDQLQRHEKQFLQDYYRNKKVEQPEKPEIPQAKPVSQETKEKAQITTIWNQYAPQVDALIIEGYLQKIQNDNSDDDFQVDDFGWDEGDDFVPPKEPEPSSEESDGDDIFADDNPRTITEKKELTEKSHDEQKGIVYINDHLFSLIVEKIGIHPEACIWVISNKTDRFKVSTQYMNAFYRQKELFKTFPYVSLNHSEFVKNEDIETQKGLQRFKRFNERKRQQRNPNNNRQFQNSRGKKQYLYKPKK